MNWLYLLLLTVSLFMFYISVLTLTKIYTRRLVFETFGVVLTDAPPPEPA